MIKQYLFLLSLISLFSCKTNTEKTTETTTTQPNMNNSQQTFFVGTYTDGDSQGIYRYALDANGHFKNLGLSAKTSNPSFLSFNASKDILLAVNENEVGTVTSFSVKNDTLEQLSQRSSGGSAPCYVSVNAQGFVLAANYGSGTVGLLQLDESGKLSELLDTQQHEGHGPTDRQEGPHAHSAQFSKENEVIAADLGTDQFWFSTLEESSKKLKPADPFTLNVGDGAGPRHFVQHKEKDRIYVFNELNNTITYFAKKQDVYKKVSTVSTLSPDFEGESMGADIHMTKDGRFLYASNRGAQTLAIFQVAEDGKITLIETVSVRGKHPRNFALSPEEDFVVVANRDTNNIVSFRRDEETGLLEYVSQIEAPKPVCILFK